MKSRLRRLVATFATLAVAWTALWPLVSSVHAVAFADAMPLCHQAGMQVAPDEAPSNDTTGAPRPAKQHCPLCIMAFLAMPSLLVIATAARIAPIDLAINFRSVVHPVDLSTRLPDSRAPPVSFAA
jgi:hypothetical protein